MRRVRFFKAIRQGCVMLLMFPDRKVVGVQTTELIYGGGNIHCVTQHQPKAGK